MRVGLIACALALFPVVAAAHAFGRVYNLPVPFALYAWGSVAALALSFLVFGAFAARPATDRGSATRDVSNVAWLRTLRRVRLMPALQGLSVACLAICLLTGFFGSRDPYRNFSMTFFWVWFVLGFAYLTALVGDLWTALNPWRVLVEYLDRGTQAFQRGAYLYPARLAYWPALLLYAVFIWMELFVHPRPSTLAAGLLAYTGINLIAVRLWGADAWFRHGECFGVMLRLFAKLAPIDYQRGRLRFRAPFSGALEGPAESLSLLLFVLFMLSSTAFDGLRATVPWFKLFWGDATGLLHATFGAPPITIFPQLLPWYRAWELIWLLLSPFLYLAVYVLCIAASKALARSPHSVRELALRFAFTLLPIVLVYHFTHYFTLMLTQGPKILSLLSDPFGWGWDLFGTARKFRAPYLPQPGSIWHTQVGMIVLGHVISVWLAHREALRVFATRRAALLSQLPMLVLMMAFTAAGLWILAQPIQAGR